MQLLMIQAQYRTIISARCVLQMSGESIFVVWLKMRQVLIARYDSCHDTLQNKISAKVYGVCNEPAIDRVALPNRGDISVVFEMFDCMQSNPNYAI